MSVRYQTGLIVSVHDQTGLIVSDLLHQIGSD